MIKPIFKYIYLSLIYFVILSNCINAQTTQDSITLLQEVEITATKIFCKETAGMKESLLDSLQIKDKLYRNLSDILSESTSIFIKSNGRGALSTASFRGTSASHTQVMWNGIKINSYLTGGVDFSLIPTYIADEINLKHGNASIADNCGGLGGSINISNSANWQNGLSFNYTQGLGSYKTFDEFFTINFGTSKFQTKTKLYHNYSKNDYKFLNRSIYHIDSITGKLYNPIDTNKNAEYYRYGLLQEIYYRTSPTNIFSIKYWLQKSDRSLPRATSFEGNNNSNINKQKDDDHKLVADWTHLKDKSKLIIRTAFSSKKLIYSVHNYISGYGYIPVIFSTSSQVNFLGNGIYEHEFKNNFSLKVNFQSELVYVETIDTVKHLGFDKRRIESSGYISFHKQFFKRLNFNFMFRQNVIDKRLSPFIPYFGFDYKIFKKHNLILKCNISRNYRFPNLNDLYWQPGANPNLKPELGYGGEGGLEYYYSNKTIKLNTKISCFRSEIKNWIIWLPSFQGYWEANNINLVITQGVETDMNIYGKINNFSYNISATYTYTDAKNYGDSAIWGHQSYAKQLVYIPLHSGNVFINLNYKDFFISYQHNSYSKRYTTSSNDISSRNWLYPYFMNDLSLGKNFTIKKNKISTEFKIYNLFNETYHSVLYRPMPKRNYMFILKFTL